MYFGKVRRSQDKELMIMTKGIEIQTVHQNTRDYIKSIVISPNFYSFVKPAPVITDVGLVRNMVLIRNNTCGLLSCLYHRCQNTVPSIIAANRHVLGTDCASCGRNYQGRSPHPRSGAFVLGAAYSQLFGLLCGTCQLCETCTRPEG